jgi:hypothetical protein
LCCCLRHRTAPSINCVVKSMYEWIEAYYNRNDK